MKKIRCSQKYDFLTLNSIFGPFHYLLIPQGSLIQYPTLTPQKWGFARVGCGGVLGDENIHNLGSYGEGFGHDTIILGET